MNWLCSAWSQSQLLVIGYLWLATSGFGALACADSSCAHPVADDMLSLLQTAAAVQRSGLARVRPGRNDIVVGGGLDDEGAGKLDMQILKDEEHALKHNLAFRHTFPTDQSSPDDVANCFSKFGYESTGQQMKNENIDGKALLRMGRRDLQKYGLHYKDVDVILSRIQTAQAQPRLRKAIGTMAESTSTFSGSSALHEIVGTDGIFVISLDRMKERFNYSAHMLGQIGVRPIRVSAVDATAASEEELAKGCIKDGNAGVVGCWGKGGTGCKWPTEQAVASSHRKALEMAKKREAEWTAILEDDVVPAPVDDWNVALRDAWARLPARVKFVRLGWCQLGTMDWKDPLIQTPYATTRDAVLIQKEEVRGTTFYDPGGCTTAYMVHKDILDELLNLFPCCGPVDSCYKWDYFKGRTSADQERGITMMMSVDSSNKPLWDWGFVEHHGLLLQDRGALDSSLGIKSH